MSIIIHNPKSRIDARKLGVSGTGNARAALSARQSWIESMVALLGGLDIVFNGGTHDWSGTYTVPDGVTLQAADDTTLRATTATGRMIWPAPNATAQIEGEFIIDMNELVSTYALDGFEATRKLLIDGVTIIDAGDGNSGIRTACDDAIIRNVRGDGTGNLVTVAGGTGIEHVVSGGETLSGIAHRYAVSIEDILEPDGERLDTDLIRPGQTLLIRPPASGTG